LTRAAQRVPAAWIALAALLGAAALLGRLVPATAIDWQPALVAAEPWRAVTAVAVHYSTMHLLANLAGLLLVGALGWVGEVPARGALAWAAAWPLTQLGLAARPELAHYGGLSGVLHAGVAVVAVQLLAAGPRARRLIAAAILAGLTAKVLGEAPWGPAVTHPPGWDIAVAPLAHASGALAGLLCGLAASLRPAPRPPSAPSS
jgi:rhomboid family GlyGly-CTERM serine protease